MSDEQRGWTADEVQRRLAQLSGGALPGARADWPLRAASAVLHTFDPATLKPFGETPVDRGSAIRALLDDCEPARNTAGHFTLRSNPRRRALAELGSRERMREALNANPPPAGDAIQRVLSSWILNDAISLDPLTTPELQSALRVSEWLGQTLPGIPSLDEIRGQLESRQTQEMLRRLSGDRFAGRAQELDELRDFAGLPSSPTPAGIIRRVARELAGARPAGPLSISGPGGIGKSALVARLLVENLEQPVERRVPYAYFDLGRSQFRTGEPVPLVNEWFRQLRREYPAASETIAAAATFLSSVDPRPDTVAAAVRSVFERLPLKDQPYLLVLDSMEDVQMAGSSAALDYSTLIETLSRAVSALRLIVIGRIQFAPGTRTLQISELDKEAADAFLLASGVSDQQQRADLIEQVGGSPLALKLGAAVLARGGDIGVRVPFFLSRKSDTLVEGVLFDRLMGHIRDADVRQLVSVAAAVRRVSPEVIRTVLAPVVSLKLVDPEDAERLYEGMAAELALFVADEYRAIRMRSDLRQTILSLQRESSPELMAAVHRRAVDYYAARDGIENRAEEVYHHLSLNAPAATLDARWRPGIERHLYSAVEELFGGAQAYLRKRLGVTLTRSVKR